MNHPHGKYYEPIGNGLQTDGSLIKSRLQSIANLLLLNINSVGNPGLAGKMGTVLFFYKYSRFCEKNMYEELADELLDEVLDSLHQGTPIDFLNGLAGIGWGIEYLVKNKFLVADTDDILADVDKMAAKHFNSLEPQQKITAVFNLGPYLNARLKSHSSDLNTQSSNFQLLVNLISMAGGIIDYALKNPTMKVSVTQIISLSLLFSEVEDLENFIREINESISKLKMLAANSANPETGFPAYIFQLLGLKADSDPDSENFQHPRDEELIEAENGQLLLRALEIERIQQLRPILLKQGNQTNFYSINGIGNDENWFKKLDMLNPSKPELYSEFVGLGLLLLQDKIIIYGTH